MENNDEIKQPEFSLGVKHQLFNNEVRKRRLEMGLTQSQLGEMIGKSSGVISHIETLKQYPDMDLANSLAECLGATVEELFPGWLIEMKKVKTSVTTTHLVTERLLDHPEVKLLPDPESIDIEETMTKVADHCWLKESIAKVLDTLLPREKKVLEMRYGLKGGETMTYEQIGREFGVTRERVRQIERRALSKLRHPTRRKELTGYDRVDKSKKI